MDEVLRDWYVSFAGEDAAGDLAKYYEHWEDFWTRRVLKTKWFGGMENDPDFELRQYLDFYSAGYHEAATMQDMAQSRRWLESALAKTRTDEQKTRVQFLLNAFEKYEDAALYYQVNMGDKPPVQMLSEFLKGDIPKSQRRKAKELLNVLQGRGSMVSTEPVFRGWQRQAGQLESLVVPPQRRGRMDRKPSNPAQGKSA